MDIVIFFFALDHQLKLYHWQTPIYARHIASDTLHTALLPLIDKFMEIYQGKKDRRVGYSSMAMPVQTTIVQLDDEKISDYLRECIKFLNTKIPFDKTDTDLMNIRDDMVGLINQTLYLFTFQ